MTRLPPDASGPKAATTNSDRPTPAAKNANVADGNTNNRRRRGTVPLPLLQSRGAQVHPNSRTTVNETAAPIRSQSRSNNPETIHHEHITFLMTSSQQQQDHQVVHRIGSGAAAAADGYHHRAAASSAAAAAEPPSPLRCSRGQPSWPSPVKFEPEPSRIIKIRSDPTLSCGRRIRQRERGGNANASSWDYDDDDEEDREARAEDERMYDLATWRMYHRIMEARQRRQAENAVFESHSDTADAAVPTAQDVERMVIHVKAQAEASYQQRLAIMEDAIAITSTNANVDDDEDGRGPEQYYDTAPPRGEDGPPSPLTSTAKSPRGLMRMLDRARKISIGAENDTQGLFTMDM